MKPTFTPPHIPDLREFEATKDLVLERMRAVAAASEEWIALRPGMLRSRGLEVTYELIRELEQPTSRDALSSGLGGFLTLMISRENNVLGLEEAGHLPPGFAIETYQTTCKLLRLMPSPRLPPAVS